jgi:hypothetical protein
MGRNRDKIGKESEANFIGKFVQLGYGVALPIGQEKYDLIADIENKAVRIQTKTGRLTPKGAVKFATSANTGGGRWTQNKKYKAMTYYKNTDVDAFAVFCRDTEQYFLIPVERLDLTTTTGYINRGEFDVYEIKPCEDIPEPVKEELQLSLTND